MTIGTTRDVAVVVEVLHAGADRRFVHYRIRALLHAGKPNWDLLATVTPR